MRENADQNNSEYGHFLRSGEDAITNIHCIKYQNFTLFPGNAEMRSFCIVSSNPHEAGNARFCKKIRKLGEISVFYAVICVKPTYCISPNTIKNISKVSFYIMHRLYTRKNILTKKWKS